ncbi:MAG: tRNA (guanosine(46)-N7)-methyltransferase TrmB, partial [Nitrospinales bacterium]
MSAKPLISFEEVAEENPYFLCPTECPDWKSVFGNDHPLKIDIGFGGGSFLLEMAIREPECNFVGLDMYHKGIRKIVTRIDKLMIQNIRIVYGDAREKFPVIFKDGELSSIYINFPDPWPKKRHSKRRLIKPAFVHLLSNKLKQGGKIHVATDHESYAEEILYYFESEDSLK